LRQADPTNGIICAPRKAAARPSLRNTGTMTETPDPAPDVQRALMDRARRSAERDNQRTQRPILPRLVGVALALVVSVVVLFAFDRFLASMQRFLALPVVDPLPAATEPVVTEPPVTDPMPAYVVPEE
jgi:hypothetical protein